MSIPRTADPVMHIAHLTSVHRRNDVRIFLKMCRSLANHGHKVSLIVADGLGHEKRDGVSIIDAGASRGRLDRIVNAPRRILRYAMNIDADIYHFHDPELMPIGSKLKKMRRTVILDAHEDTPLDMLSKPYLIRPLRPLLYWFLLHYQNWVCGQLDGVIAATPFILGKLSKANPQAANINNFPLVHELRDEMDRAARQASICYIGEISRVRGIVEMCRAMRYVQSQAKLQIVGAFKDAVLAEEAKAVSHFERVEMLGYLDRAEARQVRECAAAGLVLFHPLPNHIHSLPNKLFEYMSSGLPIIASNFPLWKEIVEGHDCGIVVDPMDSNEIAKAIDYLVERPDEVERMGRNGMKAVEEIYNWNVEEMKLIQFYKRVLDNRA